MLTFHVLSIEETITILGPNNNYIKFTFPKSEEILNRSYKKNLNAFFLFQNDLKKAIKKSKSSSNQFVEFINNIPIIWDKTPETIKSKYKVLSEELEKLNKPSGLTIVSYDPKKPGQKKKYKRRPKENYIRQRNNKINKEKKILDKLSDDMNPEAKPPPVISSVAPSLELSEGFMPPPNESYSVSPPFSQLMGLMEDTYLTPDVNYSVIPPNPLPDVIPSPFQFQTMETDILIEDTNTTMYDQCAEYLSLNYEDTIDYFKFL